MRFALISDNHDTLLGMRLAGIEGVIVHDREGVKKALEYATADEQVGAVLITEKLVSLAEEEIDDFKLRRPKPLVIEIPDRHGSGRAGDSITRYIRGAIGIKI